MAESWPNPGGERYWFSPAFTIRNEHGNAVVRHRIPWRIDPGYHDAMWLKVGMRFCNVGKVFLHQTGKRDTFALERYPTWTENPLRHMKEGWVK